MKSERRHDLEANELSKQLDKLSDRVGPHSTTIVTVALIVIGFIVAAMYMQKAWASRQQEAWDVYNLAVEGTSADLEMLKQSAESHAGSQMAEWSSITWADGHVYRATRLYFRNRAAANDDMNKAESAYQSLINTSSNPTVRDRAHFGLARIYEMRNDVAKAREHYAEVSGAFEVLAKERLEALEKDQVVVALDWLASAEPPPRAQPTGPGVPGVKPEFGVDDMGFPEDTELEGPALGEMLERFGRASEEGEDRYTAEPDGDTEASPLDLLMEPAEGEQPADDAADEQATTEDASADETSRDDAATDERSSDEESTNE